MRKNLLKYINVKECAAEAEFFYHGPSFILPNVACSCRYYLTRSNQVDYSFDAASVKFFLFFFLVAATVMTTETSIYAATQLS